MHVGAVRFRQGNNSMFETEQVQCDDTFSGMGVQTLRRDAQEGYIGNIQYCDKGFQGFRIALSIHKNHILAFLSVVIHRYIGNCSFFPEVCGEGGPAAFFCSYDCNVYHCESPFLNQCYLRSISRFFEFVLDVRINLNPNIFR